MVRTLSAPRIIRSVSLSYEFDCLCREHNISLSEAIRIGISVMLGDRGIKDYDNDLNLYRNMQGIRHELERVSKEYNELKEKIDLKDNVDNVFNG